jgi:hypothetical protein
MKGLQKFGQVKLYGHKQKSSQIISERKKTQEAYQVTGNIKSGGKVWIEAEDEKCETNGMPGNFFFH